MDPRDERFVKHVRRMQPVLPVIAVLSFVAALFAPVAVEFWAQRGAEFVFSYSPEVIQKFGNSVHAQTKLEFQLKRVALSQMETRRVTFFYVKILIAAILAGPLFVFGIACLNDYRTNRRFLKLLSQDVGPPVTKRDG